MSVYPALLARLPACPLIAFLSESLTPTWRIAVGLVGCDVTKHIRDGYSRLVKACRSIQTLSLLSSPSCVVTVSLFFFFFCLFHLLLALGLRLGLICSRFAFLPAPPCASLFCSPVVAVVFSLGSPCRLSVSSRPFRRITKTNLRLCETFLYATWNRI